MGGRDVAASATAPARSEDDDRSVADRLTPAARRSMNRSICIAVVTTFAATGIALGVGATIERATMLGTGLVLLDMAYFVGRYRRYHFSRGGEHEDVEATEPTFPVPVVVTGLVLAGVGLLVAVSPTTFGDAIRGPAWGAMMVVEAANALWELAFTTLFTGAMLWWLVESVRHRDRAGVAGALVMLAFSAGTTVAMRLFWPSAFDAAWEQYAEPIRYVVHLF